MAESFAYGEGWRDSFVYRLPSCEVVAVYDDITDKIEAEQRERRIHERFELAMNAVRGGIWDWNVATGEVYYSPSWAEILEETEVEPHYRTWESRIHPDDRGSVAASLEAHLEGRTDH